MSRLLLALSLLAAVAAVIAAQPLWTVADSSTRAIMHGPLEMKPLDHQPDWVREAVAAYIAADYQVEAALIDLDRDGQVEILLAAAPRRFDVHVPERPLEVFVAAEDGWQSLSTGISCRPNSIGAFVHQGWWDIRCRKRNGKQLVLRWSKQGYQAAI